MQMIHVYRRVAKALRWRANVLVKIAFSSRRSNAACNICGGTLFIKGPNGRTVLGGKYPWCSRCWSLERHRALRECWRNFPRDYLKTQKVVQFSDDPAVSAVWFDEFTLSTFGSKNSLDIQAIAKPDSHYDIVICNQVLEHVPFDRKALAELLRVTKPTGFVQLGVPSPLQYKETIDWGYPRKEDHGHYRVYGLDICDVLSEMCGADNWCLVKIVDPVTNVEDCVFLLSHSRMVADRLRAIFGH